MKEQERILELESLLDLAWGVIANVGMDQGGWDAQHKEWLGAAFRWRDRFHRYLDARPGPVDLSTTYPTAAELVDAPKHTPPEELFRQFREATQL